MAKKEVMIMFTIGQIVLIGGLVIGLVGAATGVVELWIRWRHYKLLATQKKEAAPQSGQD